MNFVTAQREEDDEMKGKRNMEFDSERVGKRSRGASVPEWALKERANLVIVYYLPFKHPVTRLRMGDTRC